MLTARDAQRFLLSVWTWPSAQGGRDVLLDSLTAEAATELQMQTQFRGRGEGQLHFCQQAQRLTAMIPTSDKDARTAAGALAGINLQYG